MRTKSSAQHAAHSPSEAVKQNDYVIHWPAVVAAGSVIAMLMLGIGGWWWAERAQQVQATAEVDATTRSDAALAPRETTYKQLALRRDDDISRPPIFVAEALETRSGSAAVTTHAIVTASSSVARQTIDSRVSDAALLWSQVERRIIMPDAPADVVRRIAPKSTKTTVATEKFNQDSHDALIRYLVKDVRELDVNDENNTATMLFQASSAKNGESLNLHAAMLREISREHCELFGLPLLDAANCQADAKVASKRSEGAAQLRRKLALGQGAYTFERLKPSYARMQQSAKRDDPDVPTVDPYYEPTMYEVATVLDRVLADASAFEDAQQVAILEQMLQCEEPMYRCFLIHRLKKIDDPRASQAIARRAVFDMHPEVRQAAREALRRRPLEHYVQVLKRGADYPWALIAKHAEETIAYLESNEPYVAAPVTDKLLRLAEPVKAHDAGYDLTLEEQAELSNARNEQASKHVELIATLAAGSNKLAPHFDARDGWVVREMVKVNHLRNCVLCHPASNTTSDPLRGQIPTPGERLPRIYYNSQRGNFVRADVVYLRQDFSVMLPVEDSDPWPKLQRFDFFVRTRAATAEEMADAEVQLIQSKATAREEAIDSIRDAVIRLMRDASRTVGDVLRYETLAL